jgi:PD-(D/E)XK nuclease superfamily
MDLPASPTLRSLESISPSFYNAGIVCRARAAWMRFGDRYSLPSSTGAMLGSSFHAVMQLGNRGELSQGAAGLQMAKEEFDKEAQRLFAHAHTLLKAKYATPLKIPYYSIRRSRAAALALQASAAAGTRATKAGIHGRRTEGGAPPRLVEQSFQSKDRTVTGKLDLLEPKLEKVTDYKSGQGPRDNASEISDGEVRQLRLYAYLAQENDYPVTQAAIVRGNGAEVTIPVTLEAAAAEAASAKDMLRTFNTSVAAGKSFRDIATASPDCANCPCIPFCERFWEDARPEWEEACGTHAEGTITAIQDADIAGTKLKTLTIDCSRGTTPRGRLVAEQIPLDWLSIGSSVPAVGSTVRIVLAARSGLEPERRTLHVDRFKETTIWHVLPPSSP